MAIAAARVQALAWAMIYGGLLTAGLGWSLRKGGNGWGTGVVVGGVLVATGGCFLIWVRSRMAVEPATTSTTKGETS